MRWLCGSSWRARRQYWRRRRGGGGAAGAQDLTPHRRGVRGDRHSPAADQHPHGRRQPVECGHLSRRPDSHRWIGARASRGELRQPGGRRRGLRQACARAADLRELERRAAGLGRLGGGGPFARRHRPVERLVRGPRRVGDRGDHPARAGGRDRSVHLHPAQEPAACSKDGDITQRPRAAASWAAAGEDGRATAWLADDD
mmetsp:Transcript_42521/g.97499  ORF Transcript_42521/g.97499 Transcript_42521/m.97499 type:complete len:200 (+) Transcript_42521:1036-1635(+)